MILYHGSDIIVEKPDILHSKAHLDFGMGFYTTSVKIQAERWARRKAALNGSGKGYVSVFDYNPLSDISIQDFGDDMESWIDFVCQCRAGAEVYKDFDIISGKVADDKVFRVVDMYMRGIFDKERALSEIKAYETYDQIAFISQRSINETLRFVGSYEVSL